ncbi:MAG TPA: zinc ABC transporter substrate-binding protein [Chloroflexota bacterium]
MAFSLALAACGGGAAPSSVGGATAPAQAAILVVAAENFYGDVVTQVGGRHVKVTSILSDPTVDPHLYESSVENAKAIAAAKLVIVNGVGYDAFMDKLLAASPQQSRTVIDVGKLVGAAQDANPHLWYDPKTMPKVAQAIADSLSKLDPSNKSDFDAAVQKFNASLQPLQQQVAAIKSKDAGAKVLPTEPVFDYMADALGLDVVDKEGKFQKAVEEGNDPPADAVAQFRQQLTSRAIKALIYNAQTVTPITTQMQNTAKQNQVPVVGVTETEPPGKTFQQWQMDQLQELQKALQG